MKEKDLYQKFKKAWPYYINRIEPKGESGIPDMHLYNGRDVFVELKLADATGKHKNIVEIDVRRSQHIWHKKYPGKSFLLVSMDNFFYLFTKDRIEFIRNRMELNVFQSLYILKTKDMKRIIEFLCF